MDDASQAGTDRRVTVVADAHKDVALDRVVQLRRARLLRGQHVDHSGKLVVVDRHLRRDFLSPGPRAGHQSEVSHGGANSGRGFDVRGRQLSSEPPESSPVSFRACVPVRGCDGRRSPTAMTAIRLLIARATAIRAALAFGFPSAMATSS